MDTLLTKVARRIGRAWAGLVSPDNVESQAATLSRLAETESGLARLADRLERSARRVDKVERQQDERLRETVAALRKDTRSQNGLVRRVLRASRRDNEREVIRERVFQRLRRISRSSGPVLVGPWTGEVGFELLYWIPFVRWAIQEFNIDPSRITLLSRGDSRSWYAIEDAHYLDIFDLSTPDVFRQHTAGAQKQRTLRSFDRDLIRRAGHLLGSPPSILHPALMYSLYSPYWSQQTASRWIHDFAEHQRIVPPTVPDLQLPSEYVAAKFYFSKCFPDTPDNRKTIDRLIASITHDCDVVLLTPSFRVDEHRTFEGVMGNRVHGIGHLLRPENNLALQTAVVGGAKAFIGTYGGFSYLAPLCGVNAVALYSHRTYFPYHVDFAEHVFSTVRGGSLTVADASVWPLLSPQSWQPAPTS